MYILYVGDIATCYLIPGAVGKCIKIQRFSSPNPMGRGAAVARSRPMGMCGARGESCPSGERQGSAAPAKDNAPSSAGKSFHASTVPTNRGQKQWSPGSIPPRTVWKPPTPLADD